jgi:putative transposase
MSGHHKLKWLCEALLVSRSGYYDWRRRQQQPGPRARANLALRQRIRVEFERNRKAYGSPRLAEALGMMGSRHRVARLSPRRTAATRSRSRRIDCQK